MDFSKGTAWVRREAVRMAQQESQVRLLATLSRGVTSGFANERQGKVRPCQSFRHSLALSSGLTPAGSSNNHSWCLLSTFLSRCLPLLSLYHNAEPSTRPWKAPEFLPLIYT